MNPHVIPQLLKNLVTRPLTVPFPHATIPIPDGYRGEHQFDPDRCISCGLCAMVCPNRAIEMVEAPAALRDRYPKRYPEVDLGKCCFCGLCQDICPKEAIVLTKNFFLATPAPDGGLRPPFAGQDAQ